MASSSPSSNADPTPTGDGALITLMPWVFVALWSTGFIGAKFGLPYAEPLTFLFTRFSLLVVLLLPIALIGRVKWPSWQQSGHIAVAGVLVHGVYLGGVFMAIDQGLSAGLASLIVGLQPLLTAVVVGPFLGEQVALRQWCGFFLGLIGVGMVVGEKLIYLESVGFSMAGLGLSLAALVGMTIGTVYQKRFCVGMELRSGTVIQYLASALPIGIMAYFMETMEITWSAEFIFALAWLVFVLSIGAISLLMVMIRRGAVARVASFFYMVPPVTALVAWALFDEKLGLLALCGMALAVSGVALVVRKPAF